MLINFNIRKSNCNFIIQVAVIIGELIGRYTNDWIMNWGIRRNKGTFEAEVRLWSVQPVLFTFIRSLMLIYHVRAVFHWALRGCYIAIPLYLCGFIVLGAAIQMKLSVGALVMGWGIAEVATMINTVVVCE